MALPRVQEDSEFMIWKMVTQGTVNTMAIANHTRLHHLDRLTLRHHKTGMLRPHECERAPLRYILAQIDTSLFRPVMTMSNPSILLLLQRHQGHTTLILKRLI